MLMLNRTLTLLRGRSRTFPRRTLEVKCLEINMSWVHPLTPGRPLGALARTARVVTQAFERAMAEAGGSAWTWQVLLLARSEQWGAQARDRRGDGHPRRLIHHVNALEAREHVRRGREAGNRRVQRTALTRAGEESSGGYGRSPCATTSACARSARIEQTDRATRGTPRRARSRARRRSRNMMCAARHTHGTRSRAPE